MKTHPSHLSRRQFLKILAVGSAAGALALRFNRDWLNNPHTDLPAVIHETHFLMGSVVTLTLVGSDPIQAKTAAKAALGEMQRLASIFTRFELDSPLSRLNAQSVLRSPDPALVTILQQAEALSQASDGAFDVSIQPLLDLYRARKGSGLPARDEIRAALKKVDFSKVRVDPGEIGFAQAGMGLSLDGIAKGAVIDGGTQVLRKHGFPDVIVEAGGDLMASGARSQQNPWKIGLRAPRPDIDLAMPTFRLHNQAVATSGDYLNSFTPDYSSHHILDPRRGVSAPELASATVVAPTAVLADALATALMVAGSRQGLALLDQFPGCEAYLVDKDLQATATKGLAAYLL